MKNRLCAKCVFDRLAAKSRDSLYLMDSTVVKAHRAEQPSFSGPRGMLVAGGRASVAG